MEKMITAYKNGNANIFIYEEGTRVIAWPDEEELKLNFPVSMDFKITNWCDENCPMCHEMSNPEGKHGDIMNLEFINHLHAGIEIALGGGKVTSHPDLIPFLKKLKSLGIIPSITVHQNEYALNKDLIKSLIEDKLIYGLGVSYSHQNLALWDEIFSYPNAVAHVIAGYHNNDVFNYLTKYPNAKILILGYKHWGRGAKYNLGQDTTIKNNIEDLKENLFSYVKNCKVVSFDNLAIEQLDIRNKVGEKYWEEFYQGDDGTMTMYVDGVKEEFARTSISPRRYKLKDTIEEMFKIIKGEICNDICNE